MSEPRRMFSLTELAARKVPVTLTDDDGSVWEIVQDHGGGLFMGRRAQESAAESAHGSQGDGRVTRAPIIGVLTHPLWYAAATARLERIVEEVRDDVLTRCPPLSVPLGTVRTDETDTTIFERGYDAALDAVLRRWKEERGG